MNKIIKTKASAEATPPGTSDPPQPDKDEGLQAPETTDATEPKTDTKVLEEIQDRPHPFK